MEAKRDDTTNSNTLESTFTIGHCTTKCQNVLSIVSVTIVGSMESAFYRYGVTIGKYPVRFILLCMILTSLCSIGFVNFTADNSEKQFMSAKSHFRNVLNFIKEHYRGSTNRQMILFEADNVLDKSVLLEMLRIRENITNMTVEEYTWETICSKNVNRKRNCEENIPSNYDNYCSMQDSVEKVCREYSIFELWGYDRDALSSSTNEDIVSNVNAILRFDSSLVRYLGKPYRNADGRLEGSRAITHVWYTDSSKGDASYNWEGKFINRLSELMGNAKNVSAYYSVSSSYARIVSEYIFSDLKYLSAGFFVEFLYVTIMLGKFNLVEQRPILSLLGLSCVGLALAVSYGLSSALGVTFGPINSIMPFLLLGLGIDDMFVIMTSWNNLSKRDQQETVTERIGLTMKRAGVSITITSVTDFFAFAIGGTTVIPSLRSFCLYAAVGTAAIYFFQATFFVACLALDQRRLEDKRQGFLWCWKMKNWTPGKCSQKDYLKTFFENVYSKMLFSWPAKIIVLFLSIVLFCSSAWGVLNLRQEFDSKWLLPQSSDLAMFINKYNIYYPPSLEVGSVYFSNVSYLELPKVEKLTELMRQSTFILRVESWYEKYKLYLTRHNRSTSISNQTEEEFQMNLGDFLYSCEGSKYREANFRFNQPVNCSSTLPQITAFTITYIHNTLSETNEKMEAMEDLISTVKKMKFTGFVFPYSPSYVDWETNYIIGRELLQNICIALVMVFLVAIVLLTSLPMSLMVMLCVLMTLTNVGGLVYYWGLTIDTISAISLVLAIGLSVDYAAHVAHTFMTVTGTKEERAQLTLGIIGPAVFNGGFSTFLSYVFLSYSDSYVFKTFFKVFLGLCLYGLFHGLVFLPVLLSLVGPAPYATVRNTVMDLYVSSKSNQSAQLSLGIENPSVSRETSAVFSSPSTTDLEISEIDHKLTPVSDSSSVIESVTPGPISRPHLDSEPQKLAGEESGTSDSKKGRRDGQNAPI